MEGKPFGHYLDRFAARWGSFPQWRDLKAVLDWVSEKPGAELGWGEIARIIGGSEASLHSEGMAERAITTVAILTGSPAAIAAPFFKVRAADGSLYPVEHVRREAREGLEPFLLEATGELIADFGANAFPYVRFAQFQPSVELAPATPRA